MSGERLPIWEDADIKEAMKERPLNDICCLSCPDCGRISYYNQGSWFTCQGCEKCWYCAGENENPDYVPEATLWLHFHDVLTLDDVLDAECSDYP